MSHEAAEVADESVSNESASDASSDSAGKDAADNSDAISIAGKGETISDFDEYINGEWKKEQEAKNIGSVYRWDDEAQVMNERMSTILSDTDISALSPDDGLYKLATIYQELIDTSDHDERIETIKEHLAPIEQIKSLDDIYALYGDEEYSLYNNILKFKVVSDYNGYNSLVYSPNSFLEGFNYYYNLLANPSDEQQEGHDELLAYFESLGYSEDRTLLMLENSIKLAELVDTYRAGGDEEDLFYITSADLDEGGVTVPVMDILVNLKAFGKKRRFTGRAVFCDFVNEVYQPENIELIRDSYLCTAILKLADVGADKLMRPLYEMEYPQLMEALLKDNAPDVLNLEYQKRYVDKVIVDEAYQMTDDIKNAMREVIAEADWLTPHGKELAKHKLLTMHASFGVNCVYNDFEDLELTDNIVENFIGMMVSNERFYRKQTIKEDENRELFGADIYEINGRYFAENNSFYVTNGLMGQERITADDAYEVKLALLGNIIAHEIAHSYDPKGIEFDYHAYYEPWMTDEERASYQDNYQKITEFFDGMQIEFGKEIDSQLITNETFADLLGIKCCLKLLEQQENPDYDLFFRTYAMENACYYDEEAAEKAVQDDHLPYKQRINYVLGQFDKFYEVYDIDENSPFFVPQEKRLNVF